MLGEMKAALLFLLVFGLLGCSRTLRTVHNETGRLKTVRAGMLTKADGSGTACIILQTTLGMFAFTSDDIRGPKKILADLDTVTDIISKHQYLPETTVDLTIFVHFWTLDDWSRNTTPEQIARFNFVNPRFANPDQNEARIRMVRDFWGRGLSREAPQEHFQQLFQRELDIRFRYLEQEERDFKKSASGP